MQVTAIKLYKNTYKENSNAPKSKTAVYFSRRKIVDTAAVTIKKQDTIKNIEKLMRQYKENQVSFKYVFLECKEYIKQFINYTKKKIPAEKPKYRPNGEKIIQLLNGKKIIKNKGNIFLSNYHNEPLAYIISDKKGTRIFLSISTGHSAIKGKFTPSPQPACIKRTSNGKELWKIERDNNINFIK